MSIKIYQDGKWISVGGGSGGSEVYVQPDEPTDAPDGTLWVDTDDEAGQGSCVPAYTESDYGKVLSATAEGLVWVEADSLISYDIAEEVGF